MNQHLTDEQFAELLAGEYSREHTSHLNTCKSCEDELGRVRSAMLNFSTLSLHGAQERSATMPQPTARARHSLWPPPAIWAAAAAGLVFSTVVGVHHFGSHPSGTSGVTTAHVHANGDQKAIVEDNALMSAIDADLRWKPDAAVNTPAALVSATYKDHSHKLASE